MNIIERDKDKIKTLLQTACAHLESLDEISISVNDYSLDVEAFLPYFLDKMPRAVDPELIADPNSEEDKCYRAYGILTRLIVEPIIGKFLDFGCGEGHIAREAANTASLAIGYDPIEQKWDRFQKLPNLSFTTSWDEVVKNAPYDFVLIYDVLDHLKDEEEAITALKTIDSILVPGGKMFIRFHPWCSRHGTHLYLNINKAYLHLCLSEKMLDSLGYKYLPTIKVIHPLQTYDRWLKSAGFDYVSRNMISDPIEDVFMQPPFSNMIKANWKVSHEDNFSSGKDFPKWQTEMQFIDYQIVKPKKE